MRIIGLALLLVTAASTATISCKDGEASQPPAVLPISPNQGGEWLHTEKNRLLLPDGTPFHGRGANLQDTRSCNACAYEAPHPEEVIRRADELVDRWHANFIRLTLESYAQAEGRRSWQGALEDSAYLAGIVAIVDHLSKKPGVYVEVSVWHDASLDEHGWPTDKTRLLWGTLVHAFAQNPRVLFGVATEPEGNADGKLDAYAWDQMNRSVEAIRAAEGAGPHHIAVVQGTRMWARRLDYYVRHPITAGGGIDVAYESHTYDGRAKIDELLDGPAKTLPVIIGEFGPVDDQHLAHMSIDDCTYLMKRAEEREVPYLAWTFHMRCPPSLLEDRTGGTCGDGMALTPTPWGVILKAQLSQAYGAGAAGAKGAP